MKATGIRTTVAAILVVAVLMVVVPGLAGPHSASVSGVTTMVTYNSGAAAKFHAPVSTIGDAGLTHQTIPTSSGSSGSAGPALAPGGGMTTVPSNALRFINDGSYMPQSETSISVDPANTSRVVGSVNDARMFFCGGLPRSNCPSGYTLSLSEFSVSGDSGATLMKSNDLPGLDEMVFDPASNTSSPEFLASWGDPSVAAGVGGNFYYASLAISLSSGANGIELAVSNSNLWNSRNGCVTPLGSPDTNPCWTATLVFGNLTTTAGSFEDKELIAVDHNASSAFYGDVYIAWDHFFPTGTSSTYMARCTPALVCTMISGGGAGGVVSGNQPFVAFSTPAVDGSGNLYVEWCNFGTVTSLGPISCFERGSTNGGSSWGSTNFILNFQGKHTMLPWAGGLVGFSTEQFRTDSVGVLAADTSGKTNNLYFTIDVCVSGSYLAFDAPFLPGLCGQSQVITTMSSNGGSTWSTPLNLSTPAVNVQPWVSVDPTNGNVLITYYSSEFDPFNHRLDVVSSVSTNQGSSYTQVRLTNVSNEPNSDPNDFYYFGQFGGAWSVPQYGDYMQAVGVNGQIWALFTGDYQAEQGTFQADPFLVTGSE